MKTYFFYNKNDDKKEPINSGFFIGRKSAAKWFASVKRLNLKDFLEIYSISQ